MSDYGNIEKILSVGKEAYKKHCTSLGFCERCEYNCDSADRIDCFGKFITANYNKIKNQ